ncbi:Chromosomal replication initiator protein DnaA [subsurface metagenome]
MADQDTIKSCEEQKAQMGYAPNPHCKVCHGAGYVHPRGDDGKPDYSQVVDCQAKGCIVDQKRIYQSTESYIKEKGVSKFNNFDNFKPVLGAETTLEAFRDIALNPDAPPLLMVYGTTGNGKTHLCEATVIELLKRGVDCRLWAVADLVSKLKESIPENTTELLVNSLKKLPALILDEWGQNYGSMWEQQKLEEIFVARERAELITIITSNLEPDQLDKLPERVVSRFRDKSQARLILNAAPDYRPKKKARRLKGGN